MLTGLMILSYVCLIGWTVLLLMAWKRTFGGVDE